MTWFYSKGIWKLFGRTILFKGLFKPTFVAHNYNGKVTDLRKACRYWRSKSEKQILKQVIAYNNLKKKTEFDTVKAIMYYIGRTYPSSRFYKHDKNETWNKPSLTLDLFKIPRNKRKIGTDCDDYAILIYSLCRVAGVNEDNLYCCFMKTKTEWHLNLMYIHENVPYAIDGTYYPSIARRSFGHVPYMQLANSNKNKYYSYILYLFNENNY